LGRGTKLFHNTLVSRRRKTIFHRERSRRSAPPHRCSQVLVEKEEHGRSDARCRVFQEIDSAGSEKNTCQCAIQFQGLFPWVGVKSRVHSSVFPEGDLSEMTCFRQYPSGSATDLCRVHEDGIQICFQFLYGCESSYAKGEPALFRTVKNLPSA
jgi:hypothetical protein